MCPRIRIISESSLTRSVSKGERSKPPSIRRLEKRSFSLTLWVIALTVAVAINLADLHAQESNKTTTSGTAAPPGPRVIPQRKPGEITIEDEVKAAFRVEPVVHHFDGRKGQAIPFEFVITSQGEPTDVEIRPVALRQEENGVIMPDTDSPPPKGLTFDGSATMTLKADEPYTLKGIVRVPSTQSSFHSFGLLVTDKGRKTNTNVPAAPANQSRVGIEFVTRYLLRCDINVEGVRPADAHKLVLENGTLQEVDGRPQARVFVKNPTESPLEFELKSRLVGVTGGLVGKEFHLVLPVRANMDPPDRFIARVLPGARIRLEEFVPFAVFSGDYKLETTMSFHGHKLVANQFDVHAGEADYPAQAASVAQIAAGISASPAQVELSMQRGGDRFVSVVIANQSSEFRNVTATPQQRDHQPAEWFVVRPHAFGLPAGSTRKVLVSMPAMRDPDAGHQYGLLNIALTSEKGEESGSGTIDVGLLARTESKPELNIGNLAWDASSNPPALVLPLTNQGQAHFPMNARMMLADNEGHRLRFIAGYGRWLLPGESSNLRFRLKDTIPPGRYTLRIQVDTKEGLAPIEISAPVQLTQ